METLEVIMLLTYAALMVLVLPSVTVRADIFKTHIKLLPYWVKFMSLGWMVSVICYSWFYNGTVVSPPGKPFISEFVAIGINLGLLLMAVCRDRKEDEFSDQIRLRSMYLSAILLFLFFGVFISGSLLSSKSTSESGIWFSVMILNGALLVYLTNFYLSKYFMNR
jgi:hypothetical protein